MSTSDLYKVYKTKAKHMAEYRNGWGTGPALWGYMCQKYLGLDNNDWLIHSQNDPMWALRLDKGVPRNIRLVHAMCYDHVVIPKTMLSEMADACSEVYSLTQAIHPEQANHWADIAADLRKAKVEKRCLGVGLSCTSVCDNWCSWKGGEVHTVLEMVGEV